MNSQTYAGWKLLCNYRCMRGTVHFFCIIQFHWKFKTSSQLRGLKTASICFVVKHYDWQDCCFPARGLMLKTANMHMGLLLMYCQSCFHCSLWGKAYNDNACPQAENSIHLMDYSTYPWFFKASQLSDNNLQGYFNTVNSGCVYEGRYSKAAHAGLCCVYTCVSLGCFCSSLCQPARAHCIKL